MDNTSTDRRQRTEEGELSKAALERLALCYQMATRKGEEGQDTVNSAELAQALSVDPTLVRKDMAAAGITGRPKVGYLVADVLKQLDTVLGLSSRNDAIIVGCGHLGAALAAYNGFSMYGLKVVGVFDADFAKVGQVLGGHVVLPMEKCRSLIEIFRVEIAILAVPVSAAQETTDWLVSRNIRAIWNFAPVQLRVPHDVVVRNENLAQGLAQLIHNYNRVKTHGPRTKPPHA
jgi:redox-sensing transcriptional repressor